MKKLSILASIVALLINFSAVAEEAMPEALGTCDKVEGEVSKAACDAASGVWVVAPVAK